jgi:ATP synthase protein I
MDRNEQLRKKIEQQVKRMQKSEEERPTLLAQTAYLGTLGLLFIIPVAGGTYLGLWLDRMIKGYSVVWTITFMLLGIIVGAINVYLFIKTRS